eukprot:scaffold71007_cov33-Prasinocladus_malaysianus.AAC.1
MIVVTIELNVVAAAAKLAFCLKWAEKEAARVLVERLRELDPPITVQDTWAGIQGRIEDMSEFEILSYDKQEDVFRML